MYANAVISRASSWSPCFFFFYLEGKRVYFKPTNKIGIFLSWFLDGQFASICMQCTMLAAIWRMIVTAFHLYLFLHHLECNICPEGFKSNYIVETSRNIYTRISEHYNRNKSIVMMRGKSPHPGYRKKAITQWKICCFKN